VTESPSADSVEESDEHSHVRYRDLGEFDTIRTPDQAANTADSDSVCEGRRLEPATTRGRFRASSFRTVRSTTKTTLGRQQTGFPRGSTPDADSRRIAHTVRIFPPAEDA
jgi:hypothetical protein